MIRNGKYTNIKTISLPRMRGDDPKWDSYGINGWRVCPACAGMIRCDG